MAGDDVNERDALRQVLEEKCPAAIRILKDDDINRLVAAGFSTAGALAAATREDLVGVLPGRPGVVGLLLKAFVQMEAIQVNVPDGTVKKYKPGLKNTTLLATLKAEYGVGNLEDSDGFDITYSGDCLDAGLYTYVPIPSSAAAPLNKRKSSLEASEALRQVLEEKCPAAIGIVEDDDISKLVAAGYFTTAALAEATREDLVGVLPGRRGVVGLLLKAFVLPADSQVEDDIIKLVAAGFSTAGALATATKEDLDSVFPRRPGVGG